MLPISLSKTLLPRVCKQWMYFTLKEKAFAFLINKMDLFWKNGNRNIFGAKHMSPIKPG
jgi:hypothetical protein